MCRLEGACSLMGMNQPSMLVLLQLHYNIFIVVPVVMYSGGLPTIHFNAEYNPVGRCQTTK